VTTAKAKRPRSRALALAAAIASGGPPQEPYVKGDAGQARLLEKAHDDLLRKRRAFRLRGVFWYSWRDKDGGDQICAWCGHAGDGSAKPAWDAFVKVASG
jgi:hypothetical protein